VLGRASERIDFVGACGITEINVEVVWGTTEPVIRFTCESDSYPLTSGYTVAIYQARDICTL